VTTPDHILVPVEGFARDQWNTALFPDLETGSIFMEPNHGAGWFVAMSAGVRETEGFAAPVTRRQVSRAVRFEDRTLSNFGQVRYLGAPEAMRIWDGHRVLFRRDVRYRIWDSPAPGRADFALYLEQIDGCHCPLCLERMYAASSGSVDGGPRGRLFRIASRILLDALKAGGHVRVEEAAYLEQRRAEHQERVRNGGDPRGHSSSGSFMATGMGLGMTPGGVTGSVSDERWVEIRRNLHREDR
jgi:hypothetical protein